MAAQQHIRMAPAVLVEQAVATARGWVAQGCPPESREHMLSALARIEAQARG
jgi:hypothetical protein